MIAARVEQLEATFRDIAATRMAGVPICNPRLSVRALGFERCAEEPDIALGVLVTPWFMNLVRLPLDPAQPAALRARDSARRCHGAHSFDFIGAFEPRLGPYESCSLFSPMAEFADQAAAEATALQVLALLRTPLAPPARPAPPQPARRGFLLGRGGAAPTP